MASYNAGGAAAFNASTSPAFDATFITFSNRLRAGYKIYNDGDTLVDHTVDKDDQGNNNCLATFYVTFTE